jgi:hypothetical protein
MPEPAEVQIDLSDEKIEVAQVPTTTVSPLDLAREDVRGCLAQGLALVLGLLVLGALTVVYVWPDHADAVSQLLERTLTPIVGLVGSAIGFYFGASSAQQGGSTGK